MTYVEIAIAKQHTGDKFFSYETDEPVAIGAIARIPYGRSKALGVVVGIVKKPTFKTKAITETLPFILPKESLELMQWMYSFYPDDRGLITQLFVPSNFVSKPKKQTARASIGQNKPLPPATPEQQQALQVLLADTTKRALLHGDTGTGKTRVFIEVANKVLAAKKSVLILTPEIGLTPQLIQEISEHTIAPVVLTHSELTPVERRRVWERALESAEPQVFVGPRSALFLPITNLGLVVIDEAHDSSYKQGNAPRYQSLHIAARLAGLHEAQLIQSTATPNVDDYELASQSGYAILRMKTPAAGSLASTTELIDITNRENFTKNPYLSNQLIDAINSALSKSEQIMLFLNRRGSARLVQCASCGWQALCPRCGIPLTFHHDQYTIRCHTCGYKDSAPTSCPVCASAELSFKSIGTKTLVEQTQKLFPKARIMRFDADSNAAEQLHRHIETLKSGEVDIVIGTQLISKGIDLPNLSIVGVINADTGLNLPDFRAEETTFQQLYQVTGRVGRGHKLSKSFVQSRLATHPVMEAVLQRSWENYYNYELHKRKQFSYPPYCFIAIYKISKKTSDAAESAAQKGLQSLSDLGGISLLGPSPSYYEKSNDMYTWQIIAKSYKRSKLTEAAKLLPNDWLIDIDPVSLL